MRWHRPRDGSRRPRRARPCLLPAGPRPESEGGALPGSAPPREVGPIRTGRAQLPEELVRGRERDEQCQRAKRSRRQERATGEPVARPVLGPEDRLLCESPRADEPADAPDEHGECNEDEAERREHEGPPFLVRLGRCPRGPAPCCGDVVIKIT